MPKPGSLPISVRSGHAEQPLKPRLLSDVTIQRKLIHVAWCADGDAILPELYSYFTWLERTIDKTFWSTSAKLGDQLVLEAFDCVVATIAHLRAMRDEPKWGDARARFSDLLVYREWKETRVNDAIDIAVRVWLFLGSKSKGIGNEVSLREELVPRFPKDVRITTGAWPPHLTVANLAKFHALNISWTDSLEKHLTREMTHGNATLFVFDQWTYLRGFHDPESDFSPFPAGFVREVLDTVLLLFPPNDPTTAMFLKTQNRPDLIINEYRAKQMPRVLDRSNYQFFQDRIAGRLDVYNSPTTHWWHFLIDRRNKKEHFTQWLAIWAFLFAFFSLLFGLISVVFTIKQYNLTVVAACIDNPGHPSLRNYCG